MKGVTLLHVDHLRNLRVHISIGYLEPLVQQYFLFTDIALKKTTAQSSTDFNGFSSRAVDDNLQPYYDDKSCTHTKNEQNPWWRVDLGREYIVTGA